MQLKYKHFYTFFIITSLSLSTLATTDSMQDPLTQATSNQLKNKKDLFYEYDFVTYLCTYKLTSMIMTIIHYIIAIALVILTYFISRDYVTIIYIILSIVFQLIIALIWATLFRDGINPLGNRFIFWLKNISIRDAITVILISLITLLDNNGVNNCAIYCTALSFILIHVLGYIVTWVYPEEAKSILYGFSNKFPKAKGASK